jgi:hypothetical protein
MKPATTDAVALRAEDVKARRQAGMLRELGVLFGDPEVPVVKAPLAKTPVATGAGASVSASVSKPEDAARRSTARLFQFKGPFEAVGLAALVDRYGAGAKTVVQR